MKVIVFVFAVLLLGSTITSSTLAADAALNFGGRGTEPGQLDEPRGVFVDADGNVFVADTRNDRVQKFDENGVFVEILDFGAQTPSDPSDVFVDSEGNVFVADTRNNRILKLDGGGGNVSIIGDGRGTEPGQLDEPRGVFVDLSGNIYAADTRNDRVQKFDENGVFVEILDFGAQTPSDPSDVFVDSEGNVFVADTRNNRILKLDGGGAVTSIDNDRGNVLGQLDEPRGVFVDLSGNIYAADTRNDRVQKFDENGVFVLEIGEFGSEDKQFSDPSSVFVDSEGNVFVADTRNNRVQKFDAESNLVFNIGNRGTESGQLDEPRGITTDLSGNVFVADTRNDRVQKFDENGVFVEILDFGAQTPSDPSDVFVDSEGNVFVADTRNNRILKLDGGGGNVSIIGDGRGTEPGQLDEPRGVFVDADGNVFVADTRNDRVQKFDENGVFVEILDFGAQTPSDPSDVFVDSEGNVFVADTRNNRILKLDGGGGNVSIIGDGRGTEPGQLDEPRGVFVDADGNVFVADTRNDRVQKFDENGVFVLEIGEFGSEDKQFSDPSSVFVDSEGNVFVADTRNNRVQKFDAGNTDDKIIIIIIDADLSNENPFSTVSFDVINPFNSPVQKDNTVVGIANFGDSISDIVDAFVIPKYKIDDQYQIPNTTWSVPATVIPLDTLDGGNIVVVSVNELASEQEMHISINNNEGLSNGGNIRGIQFVTNDNINNLKFGASITEEPLSSIPKSDSVAMYITFDAQGQVSTNEINLDETEQFKAPPTISFTVGPIENSIHPTHPKSVKSNLITCPNIGLGEVGESTGTINFSGILVFRNTNGDTIDSCGYTAYLKHFSTYAVVPMVSTSGGDGGDSSPPSIRNQIYDDDEYPLIINGMGFKDLNYANKIETQTIKTGEKFNVTMLINDNSGLSAIEFVGLFTNLNGHNRQVHQSDTYITYNSNEKLQFFDPNEFFSKVDMTKKELGNKLELSFDITFDKEMPTSDIIIRMWDVNRNSQDTILSEVIKVTEADTKIPKENQSLHTDKLSNTLDKQIHATQSNEFKNMVEMWGGYHSNSISDSDIMSYMGMKPNENSIIPKWFKANIPKWILKDQINQEELKNALMWMDKKGII